MTILVDADATWPMSGEKRPLATVLAALVDHPAERLEVEKLPLDAQWRYSVFAVLPVGTDANKAVVAELTSRRDEAVAHG